MTEEKRNELLQESRLLAIASPVLLPMIRERKRIAFERLLSKFREGGTDLIAHIAELSAIDAFERDIISKEQTYKILEERQHGTARK